MKKIIVNIAFMVVAVSALYAATCGTKISATNCGDQGGSGSCEVATQTITCNTGGRTHHICATEKTEYSPYQQEACAESGGKGCFSYPFDCGIVTKTPCFSGASGSCTLGADVTIPFGQSGGSITIPLGETFTYNSTCVSGNAGAPQPVAGGKNAVNFVDPACCD